MHKHKMLGLNLHHYSTKCTNYLSSCSQQHQRLSNHCLQMIGRCWPLLLALSIGGPSIDVHGLVSVGKGNYLEGDGWVYLGKKTGLLFIFLK